MKRSNRLILLIGVFLAIVAFVGVILLSSGGPSGTEEPKVADVKIVLADVDIPLGTIVNADMVSERMVPPPEALPGGVQAESAAIGKVARANIIKGQQLLLSHFGGGGLLTDLTVPAGKRAIAIQVDQVTGVGTLIRQGDYVDVVVGLTGGAFPVVTVNPEDQSIVVVQGLNSTSVKLLLQNLQVIGTLLPPPPVDANGQPISGGDTALTGQQELVMIAGTANQIEILKFVQMDGNVSLVLRAAADYQERDANGEIILPDDEVTDGVILKSLIDRYGVLTPQLVEAILPEQPVP